MGRHHQNAEKDIDVVVIGFAPQLILPIFHRLFKGKTIVIDFFISIYDTLICDRKMFRKGGIISGICHRLDEITIKYADHVITDTQAHKEYFISEFGGDEVKYETIYLEADKNIYYPRPQQKTAALNDKLIVLYFGSILPLQGVQTVLEAVRLLKECDDIFFDIIGPIPGKYNKPMQDNVRYTDWLTQEKLADRIAAADLCLAGHFNEKIDKADRTIPGKAYIYEAMNKPMVLGDSRANRELFTADDRHIYIPLGNAQALAEAITAFRQ